LYILFYKLNIVPPDFKLKQCLFGEHLFVGNNKPVGIVESYQILEKRDVTFFPDMGANDLWEQMIKNELSFITCRNIVATIETFATEQERTDGMILQTS